MFLSIQSQQQCTCITNNVKRKQSASEENIISLNELQETAGSQHTQNCFLLTELHFLFQQRSKPTTIYRGLIPKDDPEPRKTLNNLIIFNLYGPEFPPAQHEQDEHQYCWPRLREFISTSQRCTDIKLFCKVSQKNCLCTDQKQTLDGMLYIEDKEFVCVYIHHICHYLAHSPTRLEDVHKEVWNKISG